MATGRIGVTPTFGVRWSKAPAGGTTSLSGNDDNSVPLAYSVGYENVYRNGVLLSRGNDYTATNGSSITLVDATIAGDIIEVFANVAIPLTDTYSQTAANAKFINNTLVDAKGDIVTATAADTPARLAVGANDTVLTADSSTSTGLKWAAVAAIPANSSATVATNQTTTSTSYTDLTTSGPEVTVTTGTKALVIVTAYIDHAYAGAGGYMSYAVSGASTVSASDTVALFYPIHSLNYPQDLRASVASVVTLTAGSNTFTAKYRVTNVDSVGFKDRNIFVINLA
jgi:hypothetical protein